MDFHNFHNNKNSNPAWWMQPFRNCLMSLCVALPNYSVVQSRKFYGTWLHHKKTSYNSSSVPSMVALENIIIIKRNWRIFIFNWIVRTPVCMFHVAEGKHIKLHRWWGKHVCWYLSLFFFFNIIYISFSWAMYSIETHEQHLQLNIWKFIIISWNPKETKIRLK